ncbi:MAG: NlpC/P60 family protein [Pseudomonadota bacterium]
MTFDPRLVPARADVAAAHLEGEVTAERFVEGRHMQVATAILPLTSGPDPEASFASQLLLGERFTVYDHDDTTGLSWGQSKGDGYVGHVPAAGLEPVAEDPTHHITALLTHLYPEPDMKTRPFDALPFLAQVTVVGQEGRFLEVGQGGFLPARHAEAGAPEANDWVATAERFAGLPYLWGGRSSLGLDCSALVQLACQGAGRDCPRDSDMQAGIGSEVDPDGPLARGDLVCWKGHIGIMRDSTTLLHANAFHMAVASEPLDFARDRIKASEGLALTTVRRLPD